MISPTDAIISSPSQISSLPGELLGTSSGPLSASQAKQDQLSTISSPPAKHCGQFGPGSVSVGGPLMSPLLSPGAQDSLPLSPSLGRDQLGPLSPSSPLQLPPSSPLPSQHAESWDEEKSGENMDNSAKQFTHLFSDDVAGPSNSSQDGPSWSPESDHTKQGRRVVRADRRQRTNLLLLI